MLKPHSEFSARRRRMDPGTLWPFVWAFADHLTALGHSWPTRSNLLQPARHFAVWLIDSSVTPSQVDRNIIEQFLNHRCQCAGRRSPQMSRRHVRDAVRFIYFLVENGVIPASTVTAAAPSTEPLDPQIAGFLDWLRHHRGLVDATITRYRYLLMRLLPALGPDPAAYDTNAVHRIILDVAEKYSSSMAVNIAMALRVYLRFLVARGVCRPGVDQAVPSIAQWRLAALPLYLSPSDIEKLIASCDPMTTAGTRDRVILLLVARLALRAGDIQKMRLDDIDWEEGMLRLCGKGRREIRLPIPQEVGDALLSYLNEVRPQIDNEHVFLTSLAPFRPIGSSSSISCVVARALERADIIDAPSHGTNLLRHSAATAWLRAGATLDTIGTIMRHRSADTTAHYAKIDIPTLQRVVQPWPGDVSC